MSLLTWSDQLSVGVKEIDDQHHKLVDLANEFHDAILAGTSHPALGKLLDGLIRCAATHFATEERLFVQTKYPAAQAHMREHEELVAQVNDLKQRFDAGRLVLTIEVTKFLRDWLTGHILDMDKRYGDHLNRAGVR